jgi:mRNA interferase RelE/StbE
VEITAAERAAHRFVPMMSKPRVPLTKICLELSFSLYRSEMKPVTYSREATKTLRRIPANTRQIIIGKIEQYAAEPESLANNVKALKGNPGYFRLRVGDWRIIFREDGAVIAIVRVAPRGGAYD